MSYLTGFNYDIFISYAHDDNAHASGKKGWVDNFHEELDAALVRRFGHNKISIWRDTELNKNTLFNEDIEAAIKSSALFLVLHSLRYIESHYCEKEYKTFYKHAQDRFGLSVQNYSRLLNVLLRNIHFDEWPKEFHGTTGFKMHDAPENSDCASEPTLPDDNNFAKQLRKIVDAIETTLKAFPKAEEHVEITAGQKISVYIADVADSLQIVKSNLIKDLETQDIKIISEIPPPMEKLEHHAAVKNAIANSNLSIHLLDRWPGRLITDYKESTYPLAQFEIGLEEKTPQVLWVPESVKYNEVEDEAYGQFLASLEADERRGQKFEHIRKGKTELFQIIAEKVEQMKTSSNGDIAAGAILLDTHQKDQRFAYKLADFLADKGLDVEITKESRDPVQTMRNFEEYLKYVNSLIILFGDVAPNWVLGRLKKTAELITKQFISENRSTFKCCYVYMLPNSEKTSAFSQLPGFFRVLYLDNRHSPNIDPKVLDPILATCGGGQA